MPDRHTTTYPITGAELKLNLLWHLIMLVLVYCGQVDHRTMFATGAACFLFLYVVVYYLMLRAQCAPRKGNDNA